jgi:23S rRNA pseudouridine1911/1915/1917 synthase
VPDPPESAAEGTRPPEFLPSLVGPGGKVDADALRALHEAAAESDEDAAVTASFEVGGGIDKRLDRYLTDRIPFLSRTSLQRLVEEQAVLVNGRPAKASQRVRGGDLVSATLPPPMPRELPAEEIPLSILFEDEHLVVIDKQPDLIVHPARGNRSGTLINGLAWHFRERGGGSLSPVGEEAARPGVVHRLDRHTSGVMVVAKTETAHWRLAKQFEQRRVQKRYLALVHGRPDPAADLIDLPLGKHPTQREKYAVRWDSLGKPSATIYRTVASWPAGERGGGGFALLELDLRTGRTHQIRVHLSHRGYPIAGDDLYGGRHLRGEDLPGGGDPAAPLLMRQALHAALLEFRHPERDETLRFHAPLRADMLATIARLDAAGGRRDWTGCLVDPVAVGLGPTDP